jgi:hypothetical protein
MASPDMEDPSGRSNVEYEGVRTSKFRFKSKREREDDDSRNSHRSSKRRREHASHHSSRHSHHKSRRKEKEYHTPLDDDPSRYDDSYANQQLDPETAFRESLFDALADDEGAAFWEGVYGQPIHTYPNQKSGPEGELERMSEAEYAEYVRSKMWEKSHEHIVEERRRREEEKKRRKEARDPPDRDDDRQDFEEKIEASIRRGERRKVQRRWQQAWELYAGSWEKFTTVIASKSNEEDSLSGKASRGIIPWPVESGRWKDVAKEEVEDFFRSAPPPDIEMPATLKIERVRWHPDKMQQRFGKNKLDEETVKTITAVFQVVDRLWGDIKGRK